MAHHTLPHDTNSILDAVERTYGREVRERIVRMISKSPLFTPQPAVIFCPFCTTQHFDVDEWETRPHHKHLCLNSSCGKLFRVEGADGEYFYGAGYSATIVRP